MTFDQYKGAIDIIAYGITVLSGSIGVKYLLNATKYFILHVMPLFKKSKTESKEYCTQHHAMDQIVLEFRDQGKTIIRIDARLDEFFRNFTKQEKINDEIFGRLRDVEKMTGILDDRDKHKGNENNKS